MNSNFGNGKKERTLTPEEMAVERIIRWFKSPRKSEAIDITEQLQIELQATAYEINTVENRIKRSIVERPNNMFFFLKAHILELRKEVAKDEDFICGFGICDGSGYVWTTEIKNAHKVSFKCKCSTRESRQTVWDESFSNEFDREIFRVPIKEEEVA